MILQKDEKIIYETTGQVSWGFVILWLLTLIFIFGFVLILIGIFTAFSKFYVTNNRVIFEANSNQDEIYLNQIESIQFLNGTITIVGAGWKKHKFQSVKNATEFAQIISENIHK